MGHTELTVIICEKCNCVSEDNEVFIPPDREVSYGCYGVISNQENMLQQMLYVQRYFGVERPLEPIQMIVEYGTLTKDDRTASAYSESCAEYFSRNHQIDYCIHQDMQSLRYHAHLLINPISYLDGKVLDVNVENMNRFCEYLSSISGMPVRLILEKEQT
ncbi:MAG: hypothetical protein IKP69_03890 [Oscillospiraceae bacterium]|nr:hypothetical protein [Oscillospiraceae bacterium]